MNVLVLTRYSRMGASSRVRMLQYMENEAFHGFRFSFSPLVDDEYLHSLYTGKCLSPVLMLRAYMRRLLILRKAHQFDVLWIEKELFPNLPSFFEWMLARLGIRYIVDYDDAIFHNYDLSNNPFKRLLRCKIAAVMRHASAVVTGCPYLATYAERAGATKIEMLPTVVDAVRYTKGGDEKKSNIVIGWMGSPSSAKFLQLVLPVLDQLARRFPLELAVVGANIDTRLYPFVRCRPWNEATEINELRRFDIGIMPLLDNPWEQGKCGYKLIQYMACGKPVVASAVGINKDIVINGENGFLVTTLATWYNALECLIVDRVRAKAIGERGRHMVESRFCVQVTAPRLVALMQSVAAQDRPARTKIKAYGR